MIEAMLRKIESWKDGYRAIILADEDDGFCWGQYRRLTTVECYLEERLRRA